MGLVVGCNRSNHTASNTPAPTVIATNPVEGAQDVALSSTVIVAFSEEMDSTTIDTISFSVIGSDESAMNGTVSVDAVSRTASFTPDRNFTASTLYTVTLTRDIKSAAGSIALDNDYLWTFTSGTTLDTLAPIVTSTNPPDDAIDVAFNRAVSANFSEALDPVTVNSSTFTLSDGSREVAGIVSYGGTVASFTPNSNLAANTKYTATLTTEVTDLAVSGNSLVADVVWRFTTGSVAAQGPDPVNLGSAGEFAILTKTGITNIPTSYITGDIGASPITAAALDTVTCSEITGTIYGSDAAYTANCFQGDADANTKVANAVLDMGIAYSDAAGRTTPDFTELYAGDISGQTLVPGLYKWGTNVLINSDVTLSGGANDVWIFQIARDVIQASATHVYLTGGALAKNVFWQVGGGAGVTLDTGAHFNGIVLAEKAIRVNTGATVNGRLLSQTAVTLDQNLIRQPEL